MSDPGFAALLRTIDGLPDGFYLNVDTVRDAFDAAQLTSAERGGAFRTACTEGFLRPVTVALGERTVAVTVPTDHPEGKGRLVRLYRRTGKPVAA